VSGRGFATLCPYRDAHDCAASSFNIQAPHLYDVRLMAMSPSAFTLTGLERVDGIDYAHSWLIT
jgi:hypothetical protein